MKFAFNGIHRRVGFIIQHVGGYDEGYAISKLAIELNIDYKIAYTVIKTSSNSNRSHYIELLRSGVEPNKILNFIQHDNDIIAARLIGMTNILKYVTRNSPYGRIIR